MRDAMLRALKTTMMAIMEVRIPAEDCISLPDTADVDADGEGVTEEVEVDKETDVDEDVAVEEAVAVLEDIEELSLPSSVMIRESKVISLSPSNLESGRLKIVTVF